MAIAFDPINKIIQLDSFNVSERQIWTAFVDWSVLSDNLKYGLGMSQIGGFVPIALYIYLDLGWKIRPIEANGITTISGNLIVEGGGSPISATVGNWQTLVNMETPVKAVALDSGGSSSDGASVAEIQAIVDNLNNFDPVTDTVANVTLVDTTTSNTDMRGTDNVNTTTPPTVVEIRDGFNANDFKATETISSNMRGTDGANTVEPTNQTLTVAQNAKLNSLDTDNLDEPVSTRATKADVDQALVDYNVDTKTNVKPSIPV